MDTACRDSVVQSVAVLQTTQALQPAGPDTAAAAAVPASSLAVTVVVAATPRGPDTLQHAVPAATVNNIHP